jgi:hypothetical protein
MPAFPGGGGTVANPPLYPDYVSATVFATNGNSATLSPFSGPKGSPFDALEYPKGTYQPIPSQRVAKTDDHSTGALSTGIGFETTDSGDLVAGLSGTLYTATNAASVNSFSDNYIPGQTLPSGSLATGAILTAIGGGRSTITAGAGTDWSKGTSNPNPYASQPLLDMGLGGSRDAGAGPAFTGFSLKLVTASAAVAQGAAIEAGWVNRTAPAASGISLKGGNHAFGSSTAASPAVT